MVELKNNKIHLPAKKTNIKSVIDNVKLKLKLSAEGLTWSQIDSKKFKKLYTNKSTTENLGTATGYVCELAGV